MRRIQVGLSAAVVFVGAVVLAACSSPGGGERFSTTDSQADDQALSTIAQHPHKHVCGSVRVGGMRCHAKVRTDLTNAATPSGLTPSDIKSAYKLPSTGGSGAIVAIVDANDDPNAESDLAVYRQQFGLPPCTTANGCFQKVNQNGVQGNYPAADTGWAGEISLDLDMVSAACPDCKILLVEANSPTTDDLGTAVNTAASLGAKAISNSYGGPDDASVTGAPDQYYNHPGILITASTGDSGYGASFPASSQYVLAVGGTSLAKSTSSRGWAEGAWSSGGSGCSAAIPKPSWQTDGNCGQRTIGDVSAVADPNTGVAVYVTYGAAGWQVYGGTSASAPLVAAMFTLMGHAAESTSYVYAHTSSFFDVTKGSNGSCGGSYLCTAGPGYDGPTGWGTPNGALLGGGGGGGTDAGGGGTDSGGGVPDAGGGGTPDSGGGGSACTHAICATGSTLTSSCDPCATKICAADSYCCQNQWDSVCVGEVGSICGQTCGGGGGGGGGGSACAHPICNSGGKLTKSCDTCAAQVCGADPYCCNTLWDNQCVGEVGSICGQTCP